MVMPWERNWGGDASPPPYFPGGNVTNNAKIFNQYGELANPDAPNVDPTPGPAYGHEATGPAPAEAVEPKKPWERAWQQLPEQKPQVPGFSPSQREEMASRKPTDSAWPLGNPFTDPETQLDPVAALAQSGAAIAKFFGASDTNAAKLGRDIHALPNSLGPLGYEFAPLDSAPRPITIKEPAAPSQADLFKAGAENRTEALSTPEIMLHPSVSKKAVDELKSQLNEKFLSVDKGLHPTAAQVMPLIERAAETPQSLDALARLRAKVDAVIENGVKPNGRPNQEGAIGTMMRGAVNKMIEAHPQGSQFREADSSFNRAYKDQIISDALSKARAGLDDTANNRAAMREVYNKYRKTKTFSPEELKAIRQAGGPGAFNPLRILATVGLGNTVVGPSIGLAIEHFFGLPTGSLITVGTIAKGAQNLRSDAGLARLGELIRSGAPAEKSRLQKLGTLFSPKVLIDVARQEEGSRRVQAWVSNPTALTARALAAYTSQKVKQPKLMDRIVQELQGAP